MSDVEPVDIDVDRERSMTVTFADGVACEFPVEVLRAGCPCASCRGWRERGQDAWPRPGMPDSITVDTAELNGAWGISIRWSDGHDTGIYAWTVLRRWWEAGLDEPMVIDPIPTVPSTGEHLTGPAGPVPTEPQ